MSREVCGICWCPYDEETGACGCEPALKEHGMTTLRTAAQQALAALEKAAWCVQHDYQPENMGNDWDEQITALRAALAEEALQRFTDINQELEAALAEPVQEPVAYSVGRTLHWHEGNGVNDAQLYAAPPQRKPATIDEMFDRMDKAPKGVFFGHDPMTIWMEAWRAAEQHHGIK